MNCPLCLDTVLDPSYHRGVEIDICPRCKGMWLDRGELDRLVVDDRPSVDHRAVPPPTAAEREDRPTKSKKRTSTAKRLADLFEEVLDL